MVVKDIRTKYENADSPGLCIKRDGTRDRCNIENLSVVIRLVQNSIPEEHLIGLIKLNQLDPEYICNQILSHFSELGYSPDNLVCFDSTSVMSGARGGVTKVATEKCSHTCLLGVRHVHLVGVGQDSTSSSIVGEANQQYLRKMSTSFTTANRMLVINQVVPQSILQGAITTTTVPVQVATGTNFCPVPQKLQRFLKGEPKALGVVQIMIGVINIGFGIVLAFSGSLAAISGIPFWGSIMYIISGSLSICGADTIQPCQATQGIKGILLSFTILEFWLSLFTSIYGCKATCGNPDQPIIIIQQNVDPSEIPVQIPQYNVPLQTTPITQPYDQPPNMPSYPPPYAK
ncbi:uncharacterized protein LOC127526608 [Erpetoichthys calabaricus]|uniref:uncharacterized protein LOC127526608 n=1 Tax=Erpetoichthys calabaricus TaxID=27687 RepID=UPI002234C28C|nr:uncharacterized protein LOC127526608 [Erpetoichthys calabaricus]